MVGRALPVVVNRLEPVERVAFVLHDMFAMPFVDIASVVGRSPTRRDSGTSTCACSTTDAVPGRRPADTRPRDADVQRRARGIGCATSWRKCRDVRPAGPRSIRPSIRMTLSSVHLGAWRAWCKPFTARSPSADWLPRSATRLRLARLLTMPRRRRQGASVLGAPESTDTDATVRAGKVESQNWEDRTEARVTRRGRAGDADHARCWLGRPLARQHDCLVS
jgi:hypothetical protein